MSTIIKTRGAIETPRGFCQGFCFGFNCLARRDFLRGRDNYTAKLRGDDNIEVSVRGRVDV